jgi:hypothetical protein
VACWVRRALDVLDVDVSLRYWFEHLLIRFCVSVCMCVCGVCGVVALCFTPCQSCNVSPLCRYDGIHSRLVLSCACRPIVVQPRVLIGQHLISSPTHIIHHGSFGSQGSRDPACGVVL